MIESIPSFSKAGGIYLRRCSNNSVLFPLHEDPIRWLSCGDAYEHTWIEDPDKHLPTLSTVNKLKMAKSMGFCPHRRCQLTNISNADAEGHCPSGLCYTKLENGSPSYGACCFIKGKFNHGNIIGFYEKCQATAKPIYKHSRIVLRSRATSHLPEDSFERFINANRVHENLIATQCPMLATLRDIEQMIIQENISFWIQISSENQFSVNSPNKDCLLLPDAFQEVLNIPLEINSVPSSSMSDSFRITRFRFLSPRPSHEITHVWYRQWEDFSVPLEKDSDSLRVVADLAAMRILNNEIVAINCLSGRGRTGTLSAFILGKVTGVQSHNSLVDLIVRMREQRDGLVEVPSQYKFLEKMLRLPNSEIQSVSFLSSNSHVSVLHMGLLSIFALLLLLLLQTGFCISRRKVDKN
jgi:protein tyrosine phosphatase